jgi:hypothetical protein
VEAALVLADLGGGPFKPRIARVVQRLLGELFACEPQLLVVWAPAVAAAMKAAIASAVFTVSVW